jgi:hypothetical protein
MWLRLQSWMGRRWIWNKETWLQCWPCNNCAPIWWLTGCVGVYEFLMTTVTLHNSCRIHRFKYRLNWPYLKCLRWEAFQSSAFFRFWNIFHTYIHTLWGILGRNPSLNLRFIYVWHTFSTQSLEVILHNNFSAPAFWCDPSHEVRCGIFHLWRHVDTQNISDFWSREAQSVIMNIYLRSPVSFSEWFCCLELMGGTHLLDCASMLCSW